MSKQTWQETIVSGSVDGPALTAGTAASCIPTPSRITLPNNYFEIGTILTVSMFGRISCAITTPGTARFDVRLGPAGSVVVFDTGALNLSTAGKTTVPWWLEARLICRAVGSGTATNFFGMGTFQSEAVIGSAAPAAGGNGSLLFPVGTPAVGAGCDNTAANVLDVFFTQTVATGSLTVHGYRVDRLN